MSANEFTLYVRKILEEIFSDFKEYVDSSTDLCKLSSVGYVPGNLPDYSDKNVQQLYLLRYLFSYAFEYQDMYARLLRDDPLGAEISVLSLGCGNMIDYWSLAREIMQSKIKCRVRYTGVDMIDWNYKIEPRRVDKAAFRQGDIIEFLKSDQYFAPDIYFFPKSISEIEPFGDLCGCMEDAEFQKAQKDRFRVLISLRSGGDGRDTDESRVKRLISAIESGEFVLNGGKYDVYTYPQDETSAGITHYDPTYNYPPEAAGYISGLYDKCGIRREGKIKKACGECSKTHDRDLDRSPIFSVSYICNITLTFERGKKQ